MILFSIKSYSIPGHSLCENDDYAKCCDAIPVGWCLDSDDMVFKILTIPQWKSFKSLGEFYGSPHDIRDGFIHLATGKQLGGVIDKYFKGIPVFIAGYDPKELGPNLKWENSYPHLYNKPLDINKTRGPHLYTEQRRCD